MSKALTGDKLLRGNLYWGSRLLLLFCFCCFGINVFANYLDKARYTSFSAKDTLTKVDQKSLIPIHFKLAEPGYVTLVIEDTAGIRVRNLISETWCPAGDNTVWWDGSNDWQRDEDAANHGIYSIPINFVSPGKYKVRGIFRKNISTHYEFSAYFSGTVPWTTPDHKGAWMANHMPPQAALYFDAEKSPTQKPIVLLGSYVSEGTDGFIWVDLNGNKLRGAQYIGGIWTGAPFIAEDCGKNADQKVAAYIAAIWPADKTTGIMEFRLTGINPNYKTQDFNYNKICKFQLGGLYPRDSVTNMMRGFAVYNQTAIFTLYNQNKLFLIDLLSGKLKDSISINHPKGVYADSTGRLYVLSENKLLGYDSIAELEKKHNPRVLINSYLDDPYALTIDKTGQLYISNRGKSHNVMVFNAKGKYIKSIGKAGVPGPGVYNPLHMNNPAGLTIDEKQQLWVTEDDYLPKRVSVWSLDGKLINAFYGPAKYGGGGTLDHVDKNKFYYAEGARGAMEFTLDWAKGQYKLADIIYRPSVNDLKLTSKSGAPETPLYLNGQRYFTNCYTSHPTSGAGTAFLFIDRKGVAVPVAAMGNAFDWDILKQDQFRKNWPAGVNLQLNNQDNKAFFIWHDINANGNVDPDEVVFKKGDCLGITIMPDLSFCIARLNGESVRYRPTSFTGNGIPDYNIANSDVLAKEVLSPASSGGAQVIMGSYGWSVVTLGIKPFGAASLSGTKNGKTMWSYPDLWPGLHASHQAPVADRGGELIGTTRLLGGMIDFKNPQQPSLWAINGNHGNVYLFTDDGLFVTTLFKDKSTGTNWIMPKAQRNMELDSLTLGEENFWPTITKTNDEKVYIVDGTRSSIVRIDGLETVRRLPDTFIDVTIAGLQKSKTAALNEAAIKQNQLQPKVAYISLSQPKPIINGNLDEWNTMPWVQVDNRGFTLKRSSLPVYDVSASICISGERLYGMYCTGEPALLQNSGEMPVAPFKTGGALDVMIGTSAKSDPNRRGPVAGDCRLIITMVKGKPLALLYRAVVPGTRAADRIPFSSPSNTITFDRVDDISTQIEFAGKNGNYEFSVPLKTIGLEPKDGLHIKGDIGILRGKDGQTTSRIYWSNKAAGITADVPSEAMLTPNLWGTFIFTKSK